jgi:hypothetical protein
MTEAQTASVIAILVIVSFFGVVAVVLIGFVDITSPEIAKLVGLLFGYLTALLNPIIMRYFKAPKEE